MFSEDKKSLKHAQRNVTNLRKKIIQFKIARVEPPLSLLVELKMAELLLKIESIDTMPVTDNHLSDSAPANCHNIF
jgi:hypothetical protein